MKKIISTLALATIVTAVTMAQKNSISSKNESAPVPNLEKSFSEYAAGRIKAERDFLKSKKQVENVKWYEESNGYFVYYTNNGNKGRSFYDTKGNLIYNILSYQEQSLPHDIRDQVKSAYYFDYKITSVEEIQMQGKTIYIVHLTDNKTWKIVRIYDGEMEVIQEYNAL
jgi:hypothetical protein